MCNCTTLEGVLQCVGWGLKRALNSRKVAWRVMRFLNAKKCAELCRGACDSVGYRAGASDFTTTVVRIWTNTMFIRQIKACSHNKILNDYVISKP